MLPSKPSPAMESAGTVVSIEGIEDQRKVFRSTLHRVLARAVGRVVSRLSLQAFDGRSRRITEAESGRRLPGHR
jgi:hypothetical protein